MACKSVREMGILSKCIDIGKLVRVKTHLFSFDNLSVYDKFSLLSSDFKFYEGIINPENFSLKERVAMVTLYQGNLIGYADRYPIADAELHQLHIRDYLSILSVDFMKYIRIDIFNKLSSASQADIFLKNPEWVYDNTDFRPVISRDVLHKLLGINIKFLQNHIEDIIILKSSFRFWQTMVDYNKSNFVVLLKNIQSLSTKTETRAIFKEWPHLIRQLTIDIIRRSNLDGRDWVLLINSIVSKHENMFEDWTLPADVKTDLSQDITSILISGQNKLSKRLSNSVKNTVK
jgi:hypothetical protein